ncbi:hypothetical protein NEOLEDRAFT_1174225 [Neolentinus lepideus HHB14362 ss-1]|uniref:Uncharacterized protein n=1 Tax=Neolentinus lepideus HHB14362 ss-1 TaxID=1314782 RepID=A0A165W986_9AGAM|nr:hypothetical protein NEOLEDRAFT_1174225 [Neolentinus lepideus HHB14362 ss-1]
MTRVLLPTGSAANWELSADGKSSELESIAGSFVVLQSLRQSRDQWLSSTFPKFSTKSRGSKPPEVVPPPHSITFHGRCDLEIGPHIFCDTAFFEVRYLSQLPVQQYGPPLNPGPSSAISSSSTQRASTPLISALASNVAVTPTLVSQVNTAAQTNPTLAHLVYLAASNRATPEQLKTLGLLIQSMATSPTTSNGLIPTISQQPSTTPAYDAVSSPHTIFSQEFDLVIEFKETHLEKAIFPRVPVVCKQLASRGESVPGYPDVCITTCMPFPNSGTKGPPQLVDLLLRKVSRNIWDLLCRWAGDEEKMRNSQRILDQTVPSERDFLGHRMPEGEWLKELRAAAMPEPPMKPLKPSHAENNKQRKRSTAKKPQYNQSTIDPPRSGITKNRASELKPQPPVAMPPKIRIACFACDQTDVPLLMGGRYCRQCIDAGRAPSEIPVVQRNSSSIYPNDAMTRVNESQPHRKPKTTLRTSTVPVASSPLAVNPPLVPENGSLDQ